MDAGISLDWSSTLETHRTITTKNLSIKNIILSLADDTQEATTNASAIENNGCELNVDGNLVIDQIVANGNGTSASFGVMPQSGVALAASTTVTGNSTITNVRAVGNDSIAMGVVALDESPVTFKKGLSVNHIDANEAYALAAIDGGKIQVNADNDASANVQIDGDLLAFSADPSLTAATSIDINFLNDASYFSGKTISTSDWMLTNYYDPDTRIEAGTINLRFDNGATWNVSEDNTLHGTLTLHEGVVVLGDATSSRSATRAAAAPVTLTIDNITGRDGIFSMRADAAATDHLIVKDGDGAYKLRIRTSGSEPSPEALVSLVDRQAGTATFSLDGNRIDLGAYQYELTSTETDGVVSWQLSRASSEPEVDPSQPTPPPHVTPVFSNSAQAVLALGSLGAQATQHLNSLSDLRKRLGEVRGNAGSGLWVTTSGQKDRFSGLEGTGFKQTSYRFNLGFDHAVGSWLFGANFKHATSNQKTDNSLAKGDSHAEGLNLYATYRADNGGYADFVLSTDKNHQHLSTTMSDGTPVKGTYHNSGYGISAEAGHQFMVNEAQSLFVEPQVELSYYAAKGAGFTLANGLKVSQSNYESLTARVGGVFGRQFVNEEGRIIGQAALHAGWKGELAGNNRITINSLEFSDRLMQNRFYYGFNANLSLNDQLGFYGYVERESGEGYTKEVEAGLGLKYRF